MAIIDLDQVEDYTGGILVPGNMSRQFSGALVNRFGESAQSIAAGTPADIIWGDEFYDIGDWYDDAGDQTIFTVPANVSFVRAVFSVNIEGSFSITDEVAIQFRQNGVVNESIGAAGYQIISGIQSNWVCNSGVFQVAEDDTISVQVDTTTTTASIQNNAAIFGIERVVC
jgi:hypothetical protein